MNAFEALTKAAVQVTNALDALVAMVAAIQQALGGTYNLRRGLPTRRQVNLMQARLDKRQGASERAMRRYRVADVRARRPKLLHKGGKP